MAAVEPVLEAADEIPQREVHSATKASSTMIPSNELSKASHIALDVKDAILGEQDLCKIYRVVSDISTLSSN